MSTRSRWLSVLFIIVLAALGLRMRYASGFIPLDDAEYARVAYQISQGTFSWTEYTGPPVVPVRVGIVLPTTTMFDIFGPNEWSLAAFPLMMSIGLLLIVFALTTKVYGHVAGLIAAGIWAFLPLDITTIATSLRPDLPSSAFAMLGVLIVYITRQRTTPDRSRSIIGGALAGLSFGAAWLCKESTIYFVPFCGVLVFWDLFRDWKRYLPLWGGVAAASILVVGGEMAFYAVATDDLLYRFHASEMTYIKYPEMFFAEGSRFGFGEGASYWKALAKRLFMSGPEMIFFSPEFLYLPTFGLVASLRGLYFRDSRSYFVILLFFSLIIMFNFSSVSLESYHPLPLFARYFYIICVPAAVLTGGMLAGLLIPGEVGFDSSNREGLFWGGLLAAVILGVTSYGTFRIVRDARPQWGSAEKSLANVIQPDDVVYADPLTRNGLEFFWRYPSRMHVNDVDKLAETPPCQSYVVVNRNYVDYLKLNHGMWLTLDGFDPPAFIKEPPSEWEKVWKNQWADLYRVSCG